ncbi:MAG: tetratricopeptide repeat protein [Gammaproteobacteria bacterium]
MVSKFSYKFTSLASVLLAAVLACSANAADDPIGNKTEVKDLDYGVALYYFYQEKYLEAAKILMAAKELNRLPQQRDDSDILLGGIFLQFGLHQDAESMFSHLIDDRAAPSLRDQIWYTIGKIRYQKGLRDDAIRAFEQIQGALEQGLLNESQLLLANLLMQKGEYTQAAQVLEKLPRSSIDARFAEYNLGIALFRGGREIEGAEYLAQVGRLSSSNEELLALKDKANLALGYALLGEEETKKSRAFFQKVRLKGPFSNKALLGFGWSYAMKKDFETALSSWLELRSRKRTDSAVYESLLAVGYALEQLKAFPQAMQSYLEAIQLFRDEIGRLDTAIREVKTGQLMNYLVSKALGDDTGDLTEEGLIRDVPEFRFITGIVASHKFNESIKTLRDLRLLRANLDYWQNALPTYEDMLRLRREAYEERLPKLMPEQGIYRIAAFKDEKNLYEEEYRRIVQQHDIVAVASEKELKLLDRLNSIKGRLQEAGRRMDATEYGGYEYKYNLYRGLLEWDISTTFNERIWKLRKGLNQLDRLIAETEAQQQAISTAKSRAPRGFEGYGRQINAMEGKIKRLHKEINEAYRQQQQEVQEIIVDELAWLRDRLAEYLDQAQFSLARLQDRASD